MEQTPSRQEMLKKIYEVIADKTLSFGCILQDPANQDFVYLGETEKYYHSLYGGYQPNQVTKACSPKILGHPVMLGDVLDWIEKNNIDKIHFDKERKGRIDFNYVKPSRKVPLTREYKRKPIDNQSEECITFIYNLLPHGNQD